MLQHVWFDMAGTLYRETPTFKVAHDQLRYTTYAKITGVQDVEKAKEEYEALYAQYGSNSAVFVSLGKPSDYWQKAFDELDITNLVQPDEVVVSTLAAIKGIMPISLFSNFRRDQIEAVLAHLNIPVEYFTHILSGDDIPERKPALHGFHRMIALSSVPAEHAMYIGDRVDVDIKPAKELGMKTCLIYGESSKADYCVASFSEITEVVKKAEGGKDLAKDKNFTEAVKIMANTPPISNEDLKRRKN